MKKREKKFLECKICGTDAKVPMCCENEMSVQSGMLVCSLCGTEKQVPLCCGKAMKVVI